MDCPVLLLYLGPSSNRPNQSLVRQVFLTYNRFVSILKKLPAAFVAAVKTDGV
jgi:hypothetical protein